MSPHITPMKAVLLTGAGFSKPFGGYLAAEMWAAIFRQREIREYPHLRERMLADMNFETVYEEIVTSRRPDAEKLGLTEAVWRSYRQMHEEMIADPRGSYGVSQLFLARFAPKEPREKGIVFTLNQDLFVETFHTGDVPILLPGVPTSSAVTDQQTLPDTAAVEREAASFWERKGDPLVYVKLHGSFNWWRHDQSRAIVIGTNKGELLATEPLLNWYLELFKQTLRRTQALLIIGYGFRDRHINQIIGEAAKSSGLRLHIMSPQLPEQFKGSFEKFYGIDTKFSSECNDIWQSLFGYHCGSVTDFYTRNQRELPPKGRALFEDLGL